MKSVQFRCIRIRDDRIAGLSIDGRIEIVDEVVDVIELDQESGVEDFACLEAGSEAIGEGACILRQAFLFDALIAKPCIEDRLCVSQCGFPPGSGLVGFGRTRECNGEQHDRRDERAEIGFCRHDQSSV